MGVSISVFAVTVIYNLLLRDRHSQTGRMHNIRRHSPKGVSLAVAKKISHKRFVNELRCEDMSLVAPAVNDREPEGFIGVFTRSPYVSESSPNQNIYNLA